MSLSYELNRRNILKESVEHCFHRNMEKQVTPENCVDECTPDKLIGF